MAIGNNLTVAGTVTSTGTVAMGSSFKRNRIINGNMLIDQRNDGAEITPNSGQFLTDRWVYYSSQASKMIAQQVTDLNPIPFRNSLRMITASAVTIGASDFFTVIQNIEGYNISDLRWGKSNAQPVTLSFWVFSSLTGTFGASIRNSGNSRSYPFLYTIVSPSTWTYITVNIPGDTSGTWLTNSSTGLSVTFGLGVGSTFSGTAGVWASANYNSATGAVSVVGTSAATFYITGVQLEVGTVATPYEMQIYSDQLAQCQRYYEVGLAVAASYALASTSFGAYTTYAVVKRVSPSIAQITNNVIITQANCTATTSTYIGNTSGVLAYRLSASSSLNIQFSETFGASAEL